jgi:hypothetical protein
MQNDGIPILLVCVIVLMAHSCFRIGGIEFVLLRKEDLIGLPFIDDGWRGASRIAGLDCGFAASS